MINKLFKNIYTFILASDLVYNFKKARAKGLL